MEEKGSYGETLKLFEENYSGEPLKCSLFGSQIHVVYLKSSVLSATEMFI